MTTRRLLSFLVAAAAVAAFVVVPVHLFAATSRIDIEPEKGNFKAPIKAYNSNESSGGKCIGSKDTSNDDDKSSGECGGWVKVKFTVETEGYYYFWARCKWPMECSDSFYVQVDSGDKVKFGDKGVDLKTWKWFKGSKFNLTKGEHTLIIHGREDGALLDKVVFTTSSRYTPQGKNG